MNKTSYFTFKLFFILLFLNSINLIAAEDSDLKASCMAALNKGEFKQAVAISEELIKLEPENSAAYLCKGRALGAQGDYSQALSALNLATDKATDNFDKIISHTITGNLHKQFDQLPAAIASYEKSLAICKATQNDKFARINYILMGEAQTASKDLDSALKNYLQAEKLANNDHERADGYEHIASTYSAMGKHDQAIEFQLKAVQNHKKSGTLDQLALANLQQGRIFVVAKEYTNAEKTYNKLAQFAKDNGSAYFEAKAILGLALNKIAQGDAAAAKPFIDQAMAIAKASSDLELEKEISLAIK